ncbi:MAG: hypothetical protein II821_02705 [Treponema sp.]|nr:hypothetical protein [Treponema sp.]
MSREIELKVPLTEEKFSKILNIISGKKTSPGLQFHSLSHLLKSDEYFSRYKTHEKRIKNNELRVIRIRTEKTVPLIPSGIDIHGDTAESGEKAWFCIKRKTIENGIEFNSEEETVVEDAGVLRSFFAASGFIKWFEKNKDAFSVYCSFTEDSGRKFEAHLELEKVNGLPYIEIEYTKDDFEAGEVRKNLEKILTNLGVDPKNRDSRSWPEILLPDLC